MGKWYTKLNASCCRFLTTNVVQKDNGGRTDRLKETETYTLKN